MTRAKRTLNLPKTLKSSNVDLAMRQFGKRPYASSEQDCIPKLMMQVVILLLRLHLLSIKTLLL
jgi:hypothetical protein